MMRLNNGASKIDKLKCFDGLPPPTFVIPDDADMETMEMWCGHVEYVNTDDGTVHIERVYQRVMEAGPIPPKCKDLGRYWKDAHARFDLKLKYFGPQLYPPNAVDACIKDQPVGDVVYVWTWRTKGRLDDEAECAFALSHRDDRRPSKARTVRNMVVRTLRHNFKKEDPGVLKLWEKQGGPNMAYLPKAAK